MAENFVFDKPDPSGFKSLASTVLFGEGAAGMIRWRQEWAEQPELGAMALSDGKLLIRDQSQLKCLKVVQ
jgi:hypothetical protein